MSMIRRINLLDGPEGLELHKHDNGIIVYGSRHAKEPVRVGIFSATDEQWDGLVDHFVHGERPIPQQPPAPVTETWLELLAPVAEIAMYQAATWWGIRRAVRKAGGPPWAVKLAGRLGLLIASPQSFKAAEVEPKELGAKIGQKLTDSIISDDGEFEVPR
jgi:hypothetical protein